MFRETGFAEDPNKNSPKDYYDVLGISRGASEDEIKAAFRKKSQLAHPDKPENRAKEEEFKELNEAYQVLGNLEKRRGYDLSQGQEQVQSNSMDRIKEETLAQGQRIKEETL